MPAPIAARQRSLGGSCKYLVPVVVTGSCGGWSVIHQMGGVEMQKARSLLTSLAIAMAAAMPLAASSTAASAKDTLYYVPKFTGFIFFQLAEQGAKKAADELVVDMVTAGPPQNDV